MLLWEAQTPGGPGRGGVLSQGRLLPPVHSRLPPTGQGEPTFQGRKGADAIQVGQAAAGQPEHLQERPRRCPGP